jgi:acyl-CoA dehydrogenase
MPEIYREVPGARIHGGSEDVLFDLGVRQLVKIYKKETEQLERRGEPSRL